MIYTFDQMKKAGVNTKNMQKLGVDHDGNPLRVDGAIGPKTKGGSFLGPREWTPIAGVAMTELVMGAKEIGGNNRGPWCKKYMDSGHLYPGPWCAAFVSWCMRQAHGDRTMYIRGARRLVNAMKEIAPRDVQPDDVICWERDGGPYAGHVGIVAAVTDFHIWTIEGNRGPLVRAWRYDRSDLSASAPLWGIGRYQP